MVKTLWIPSSRCRPRVDVEVSTLRVGDSGLGECEGLCQVDESFFWLTTLGFFLLKSVRVSLLLTPGKVTTSLDWAEPGPD